MHYTVHLLSNKSVLLFFVMQYQGYTSMHSIFKERFTMADQHESQVSEVGKNQNEQSSADELEFQDENFEHAVPAVIDLDEDTSKSLDLDSLKELFARQLRPGARKKAEAAAAYAATAAPAADTAGQAPVEDASANDSADRITALKAQVEQEKNNTLRALADLQNLRRRTDDERARIVREGNERLIKEILPILDDFERGLTASRDTKSYEQLIEGVDSVLRKTADVLAKQGVEPIPAVGQPFNPDLHEAVSVIEGTDQPDESVVHELQKGYTLFGRVIRPSLVSVAKS
jgi:molecular chaperone GrpE